MAQELNRLASRLAGQNFVWWFRTYFYIPTPSAKFYAALPSTKRDAGHEESGITLLTDGTLPKPIVPDHGQRRRKWRHMDTIYGIHAISAKS